MAFVVESRMVLVLLTLLIAAPECEPLPVPTRVDVYAYDLMWEAKQMPCMPTHENRECDKTKKPLKLSKDKTAKLNALLRNSGNYRGREQMKCFEPRHTLVFYYGSSLLDVYDVCLTCHNVEVAGSNPFVGCEPPKDDAQKRFTFTAEAYEQLRTTLVAGKVKYIPSEAKD
ncbi:MAG: hypothetical protein ACAI38_09810 [Myxococcota bacterium]